MAGSPINRSIFARQTIELPMWIALVAVGMIGAVFGYLFVSRRRPALGAGSPPPIQINNYAHGQAQPQVFPPVAAAPYNLQGAAVPSPASQFETFTLPATQANIIFQATGGHRWRLKLRVVSPPGAFAMFAPNEAILANTGVVNTRAIIVPSGQDVELFLLNGNRIYGRGNVADVIVSMTASVEATEAW